MKIILSHDVDHLYMREHSKDAFSLGLLKRSVSRYLRRKLTGRQLIQRFSKKLNNVEELADFNASHGLPQTFFFAMEKGRSLAYRSSDAAPLIRRLSDYGANIGLHGIAYDDFNSMRDEKKRLSDILGWAPACIRNHYLGRGPRTHFYMAALGYLVDSSVEEIGHPWLVDQLSVIPISLMDTSLYRRADGCRRKMRCLGQSMLSEAVDTGIPYFVVNFHDIYFSSGYPELFNWYKEFIAYAEGEGYEFVSFPGAVGV